MTTPPLPPLDFERAAKLIVQLANRSALLTRYEKELVYSAAAELRALAPALAALHTTPSAEPKIGFYPVPIAEALNQGDGFPAAIPTPSTIEPPNTVDEWCDHCDGCGWTEGGVMLRTTCYKCGGSGRLPAAIPSPSEPK